MKRRTATQLLGVSLGGTLFAGFFFTPALPAFFGTEVFANGQSSLSKRDLFYATTLNRLRDPTAYSRAVAGAPEGNRNLLLFGSSELSSPAPQNPARFFPQHVSDFDLFVSGRGYTQSLHQAIVLSATASETPLKKSRSDRFAPVVHQRGRAAGGIPGRVLRGELQPAAGRFPAE